MTGCALLAVLAIVGCDAVRRLPSADDHTKTVEVAVFEGGYGIEWHQSVAAQFNQEHASSGIVIDLWGEPRVSEKIKPRILRGDPPDLIREERLPIWLLIAVGKLHPFDDVLDRPTPGSDTTWREQFIPGALDTYTSEGRVYAIPSAFTAWVCWYDARRFRENGWNVPETWEEFVALCDQIKASGTAPLAFQGKYPGYAWWTFITLAQRIGGLAAINRINALEAGAFSHPDCVAAAALVQHMALEHFQRGAMAMSHTESQLQFANGHAAMVFCGAWLENEQRDDFPPGFELRCFNVPTVAGGRGHPDLVCGSGGEVLFIPADATYPEEAMHFAQYMVSLDNAAEMSRAIGIISPLQGGTPREAVTLGLASVLDVLEAAPGVFNERVTLLMLDWEQQVMIPALAGLLRGELTPEAFCRTLDEGVARALADPDRLIPDHVPYDPAHYGEPW